MMSKSEQTKQYILDSVSPIFNKKGYVGTSLSDLTHATKLTKGAIYGNFENKEDLAIKAFKHNVKRVLIPLTYSLNQHVHAADKLFALTQYYREYYDFVHEYGGCPILNIASDTNNLNEKLFTAVKEVAKKLEKSLEDLIQEGVNKKEVNPKVNPKQVSRNIYSMIEGSIFMAFMHDDKNYILEMMNQIDDMIRKEFIN